MSDADKNGDPSDEASEGGPSEGKKSTTDAKDSADASEKSRQKSTLTGQGFALPTPASDEKKSGARQKRRSSLSQRLRKLADKPVSPSSRDEADSETGSDDGVQTDILEDAPTAAAPDDDEEPDTVDVTPFLEEGNEAQEPEVNEDDSDEAGDQTDRLTSLPFEVTSSDISGSAENKEPQDTSDPEKTPKKDKKKQKSTLMMHAPVGDKPTSTDDSSSVDESLEEEDPTLFDAPLDPLDAVEEGDPTLFEAPLDHLDDVEEEDPTLFDAPLDPLDDVEEEDPTLFDAPLDPLDDEMGEATQLVDVTEMVADDNVKDVSGEFDDEKTQLSPGLDDAFAADMEGEKTQLSAGLAEEIEADMEGEKTQLSPGLVETMPPAEGVFEPAVSTGLAEDTANDTPPPVKSPTNPGAAPTPEALHRPVRKPPIEDKAPVVDDDDGDGDGDVDDFDAPDTELFQSPFQNDPICPRLTTLEGPAAGQEFLINRMRNSVGRGTNNTVIVPDLAMSRKHFEITKKSDESYAVSDLMAVNGTVLNGIKIKESDLFHGDRLEAGHSIFQFLIPGDAPVDNRQRRLIPAANTSTVSAKSREQLSAQTRDRSTMGRSKIDRILLGITIGAGILCIPLLAFLLHTALVDEEEAPDLDRSAPELYFDAVEALQTRQWDLAEELFNESHSVDPNFGEVEAQLARIDSERQAQEIVERARGRTADDLDGEIIDELRSISRDSHYFDEARSLLSLARHDETRALFDRAQTAYEEGDLETSSQTLQELLAIAPQHEGGTQLQTAIEISRQEAEDEADEAEQERTRAEAAAAAARQHQAQAARQAPDNDDDDAFIDPFSSRDSSDRESSDSGGSPAASARNINFTDGFSLYRAGEHDDAVEHFDAIVGASSGAISRRAQRTADDIRSFRDSLQAGIQARDSGNYQAAITHFQAAADADESIAGGRGYFEDEIDGHIAATLAAEGVEKFEAQNYSGAFELLKGAQSHSTSETAVRNLSRQLEDQANALYIRAANQRKSDPDGAADICRTILEMVPASSDHHRRAREMLDELG